MSKRKQKRPTTRELKRDIGVVVKEVVTLKSYVNEVLTPFVRTNMNLLEKYLEHKGEVDDFVNYLEKDVDHEKENVNKSTEKRPEKQTKGSGATKTDSKNGKRTRTGSVQ